MVKKVPGSRFQVPDLWIGVAALLVCAVLGGFSPDLLYAAEANRPREGGTPYETEVQYLSGRGKDDAVPWRFFCTSGANSGFWTNLPVPAHWDMHGFGTLNYRRDATNAFDERGLYEHDFHVPAEWSGRRVFVVFEGVMTDTSVRVNGREAGPTHQGGFYRFKYELTDLLKFGETNRLEVTVAKHSANASVNRAERQADYWVFGGIYRPVYLQAVPRQFIERVAIDARHTGEFAMDVFVSGDGRSDAVEAQVLTLDGDLVGNPFSVELKEGQRQVRLQTGVSSPRAWSAETPNLYRVEVRLKSDGDIVHRHRERFGFRAMEVRDGDGLYVNGRRVELRGVNRHSFWPDSGRCLSEAVHRLDIETIKDMNMNAVRMSHYPPDKEFLDLCDELGLYVLDELGGWHNAYDTEVGRKLVEEMVTRDVNHPCILFWNNGNEGGGNTNLDQVFHEFDPQKRRVLHPWASRSGLCTAHYLAFDKAEIAATGQSVYYHDGQELVATNDPTRYIYMPTEFMHGLYDGGGGAALEDYWNMMRSGPLHGGGSIWTLVDEAVKRPDTGELDAAGNQAPDGMVGPYREREASFYAIKEIWSPIQVRREADGRFTIRNWYNFIDASECRFTWQIRRFADPFTNGAPFTVLNEQVMSGPRLTPGESGELPCPLPRPRGRMDAIALRVDDPSGRELWTWVWPEDKTGDMVEAINAPAPQKTVGTQSNDVIEVTAGALTVQFSRTTGQLIGASRDGKTFSLGNGPRLAVGESTLTNLRWEADGPDYIVSARYSGDLRSVLWRVYGNGWVQCRYRYTARGTNDCIGVVFDYPEELVKRKRWLGDGPFRVWRNRLQGVEFGFWENDYNDTITGYRGWVYPEFKGCFANVRWVQLETAEGTITVVPENVPFVQVLTPGQPPDNLIGKTKVNLPEAGLGLLDVIPAIGTKFKDAIMSGPQSQPVAVDGEYSGSVSFYFGP